MEVNWYYEKDGKQVGPVSEDDIKASIETGYLSYGDMVWQKGSPAWIKLEEAGFKDLLTSPPPLNKVIKKRFVYIILGIFLGGWGIHNFYAGYAGRGIAQLLITIMGGWFLFPLVAIPIIIVGIWVLVEICAVTKDTKGNRFV